MTFADMSLVLGSIKTAGDMAKGILSLNKDVAVNEKAAELLGIVISLQNSMMSMQSDYSQLLESNNKLTQQLTLYENWEHTKSYYKMVRLNSDSIVYGPNESHPNPEPKHWLCVNCFEDNKKSILQPYNDNGTSPLFCPKCDMRIPATSSDRRPK